MSRPHTARTPFQNAALLERALGVLLWTGLVAVLFTKSYF
jgi:hypothetical protein